jgi:hypothetical protein
MNKVYFELEAPDPMWRRGDCDTSKGHLSYEARFCRAGTSPKPVHLGPVVDIVVKNAQGREVARKSATIGIRSDGTMFIQSYAEVASDLEKGSPISSDKE